MADEVARLQIVVDSTQTTSASKSLDQLTASAAKAEQSVEQLAITSKAASTSAANLGAATTQTGRASSSLADEIKRLQAETWSKVKADAAAINGTKALASAAVQSAQALSVHSSALGTIERVGGRALGATTSLTTGTASLAVRMAAAAGPIGIVAGLVAVLAKAAYEGQQQSAALSLAIATTGNYAGVTADSLEKIAASAAKVSGISVSGARSAATALVQTGSLGKETITSLTNAIATYAAVTGQSTDAAAKSLASMFKDPTSAALELNSQFHFLTAAQFEYIAVLQKQGEVEKAQQVLADQFQSAVADKYVASLGYMERAWDFLGKKASSTWDYLKSIGRDPTLGDKITQAQQALQNLQNIIAANARSGQTAANSPFIRQIVDQIKAKQAEIDALKQLQDKAATDAKADASKAQNDAAAIAIAQKVNALTDSLKTNTEKYVEARKLLVKALADGTLKPLADQAGVSQQAYFDQQDARLKKQFEDPTSKATNNAFSAKQLELSTELARAQNELANAEEGQAKSTNSQTASLQAWLAVATNAKGLTESQITELRNLANQTDEYVAQANAATKADRDRVAQQKLLERSSAEFASVQEELLRQTGQSAQADYDNVKRRLEESRKLFEQAKQGPAVTVDQKVTLDSGILDISKLLDINEAKKQLADLTSSIDAVFSKLANDEAAVQLRRDQGFLSTFEAQKQQVDLQATAAGQVEAMIPLYERLALASGDPRAAQAIAQLNLQVQQLHQSLTQTQRAFTDAFQGSLADVLGNLGTQITSFHDAVVDFGLGLAQSLQKSAADALANFATTKLTSLFSSGAEAATGAATSAAETAASTASTAAKTAETAASTTAATALATVSIAGDTAGPALGSLAISASIAQAALTAMAAAAANSAASSTASSAASLFADGGFTGEGARLQPAGIVHAGEFVMRSEVTREPGARPIFDALNRSGIRILPSIARGFASGGFVAPVAPRAYSSRLPGFANGGLVPNPAGAAATKHLRVYLLQDQDELAQRLANHPATEDAVVAIAGRNGTAIRARW